MDGVTFRTSYVGGTGNDVTPTALSVATAGTADLQIVSFSDGPDPAAVGQQVTFTTTVTNAGPSASTATRLNDRFDPAGFDFVSASPSRGSCQHKTAAQLAQELAKPVQLEKVICDLGRLEPGAAATLTVTLRAVAPSPAGQPNPDAPAGWVSAAKLRPLGGETDPNFPSAPVVDNKRKIGTTVG